MINLFFKNLPLLRISGGGYRFFSVDKNIKSILDRYNQWNEIKDFIKLNKDMQEESIEHMNENGQETTPIVQSNIEAIVIRTSDGYMFCKYMDIVLIKADCHHSLVSLIKRDRPIHSYDSFGIIWSKLPKAQFFRCHRSFLINIHHIIAFNNKSNLIELSNNQWVPLSGSYKSDFGFLFQISNKKNY